MTLYEMHLPNAFPFMIELTHAEVKDCVEYLMDFDPKYTPNGSSFAVTSDSFKEGIWRLWLSKISADRLYMSGALTEISQKHQNDN